MPGDLECIRDSYREAEIRMSGEAVGRHLSALSFYWRVPVTSTSPYVPCLLNRLSCLEFSPFTCLPASIFDCGCELQRLCLPACTSLGLGLSATTTTTTTPTPLPPSLASSLCPSGSLSLRLSIRLCLSVSPLSLFLVCSHALLDLLMCLLMFDMFIFSLVIVLML